jgi:hypothetical protein
LSDLAPSRVGSSDDDHGGSYFSLNFSSSSKSQGFGKASVGINYARDQKKVVNEGRHFCRKSVKCIEYLQYIYFSLKHIVPPPLEWMRVSAIMGARTKLHTGNFNGPCKSYVMFHTNDPISKIQVFYCYSKREALYPSWVFRKK